MKYCRQFHHENIIPLVDHCIVNKGRLTEVWLVLPYHKVISGIQYDYITIINLSLGNYVKIFGNGIIFFMVLLQSLTVSKVDARHRGDSSRDSNRLPNTAVYEFKLFLLS